MYAENESDIKRNEVVLNELPGEHCIVETNDKIPDINASFSEWKTKKHIMFHKDTEVKSWCKSNVNS